LGIIVGLTEKKYWMKRMSLEFMVKLWRSLYSLAWFWSVSGAEQTQPVIGKVVDSPQRDYSPKNENKIIISLI